MKIMLDMKKLKILIVFLFLHLNGISQTKRVLFLGNSYTEYFNLPQLLVNVSQSTNDVLVVDSHTPGGYTLQGHNSNAISLAKIAQGNWDFVVLQEQSQLPATPINQVTNQVFPFAQSLNNTIVTQNPCTETVFYMTWGRQNGDSENCTTNPSVCTYIGMDDLLRERYLTMTNNNNAIVSPVSVVWRYIRANYPSMNLYDPDGSHPSILGSYIAACTFYTVILRKNPTLITFNSTLSSTDANIIKLVTKNLVFDNLSTWKVGIYDPVSNFSINNITTNSTVNFLNNSTNSNQYLWDFGDNSTSNEVNPIHNYPNAGQYLVKLTSSKCGINNISEQTINTSNLSNDQNLSIENRNLVYPNPIQDKLFFYSSKEINSVEIYDAFGRLIEKDNNIDSYIDFKDKSSGIYLLKIYTNNGLKTEKIVKE